MSDEQNRPSKRRRIAGEARPGEPQQPPAKQVVKRPVTRPGAAPTTRPHGEAPESPTTQTEAAPTDQTAAAHVDGGDEQAGAGDATEPGAPRATAPRVRRRRPQAAPVDDGADEQTAAASSSETGAESAAAVGEERTRRRPSPALVLLALLTVLAVAFGGFFGYRGFTDWRQTHGIEGAHAEAAETAASAAETIFTYNYDQLDQYLEDSQEVMTSSFAKKFKTISPALNDLAPQRKIQVKATTRDAAAQPCGDDCDRDEATVLLFVDQARLADGSTVPTVFGNRVELTLVKTGGDWLVDDIKAL